MLLAVLALIGIDHPATSRDPATHVSVTSSRQSLTEQAPEAIDAELPADMGETAVKPDLENPEVDGGDSLETFASSKGWTIYKGETCLLSYGDLSLNLDAHRLNISIDIDAIPVEDGTTLSFRLAFAGEANRDVKSTEVIKFTIYRGIEQGESLLSAGIPYSLLKDFEEFTIAGLVLPDANKLVRRMPIPNGRAAVVRLAECVKTLG